MPDCKKATLQAIIRGRVSIDTATHKDGWRGYDGLVDIGYSKHFRVEVYAGVDLYNVVLQESFPTTI